jgi:hypothetical protein
MNKGRVIRLLFCICWMIPGKFIFAQAGQGVLRISFQHTANGKPLVLRDSSYTTPFNESYQVTRLKYYISNTRLVGKGSGTFGKDMFLVDAASPDTLVLKLPAGKYDSLYFTLGVDSILNCSGAQDGALDPLNGMFWTWNTGYIFFKLEGFSPSSTADLNRIEQHIGGYRGPHKAQRNIGLKLYPALNIEGPQAQINLQVNLDKYWSSAQPVKISEQPLIMSPGAGAKLAADNFSAMFTIISIQ